MRVKIEKGNKPLPWDIEDRIWRAAALHEDNHHRRREDPAGAYRKETDGTLRCKICQVDIPVKLD